MKSKNNKPFISKINWRVFAILLSMVAFGILALIPYGLSLEGRSFSTGLIPELLPQFLIQILLYSILILVGLSLGPQIGLGVLLLENQLEKKEHRPFWKTLLNPALLGLAAGILMIFLDLFLFAPLLETQLEVASEAVQPAAWKGFLASFYGGIVEEVLSRFFLLTLLALVGSRIKPTPEGSPTPLVMWISILISGLIFGLGHLPTAAKMGITLTPLYIIRTLVLNGVGILYGWLYWKKGLESAMAAHFGTDLMVHVLGALLITR